MPQVARPSAVDLGDVGLPEWDMRANSTDEAAWRIGYVWARIGRYDLAWESWQAVRDPSHVARVEAARASAARQLGLHDRGEHHDRLALEAATQPIDLAAISIGFVADAIGRADASAATERFDRARERVADLELGVAEDRQRIRLSWVMAEMSLAGAFDGDVTGLPVATEAGEISYPPIYRGGSNHHKAKGLMFAAVLGQDVGLCDRALALAPRGLTWAIHLARGALGASDGEREAREAIKVIVPPQVWAQEVSDTETWQRLVST